MSVSDARNAIRSKYGWQNRVRPLRNDAFKAELIGRSEKPLFALPGVFHVDDAAEPAQLALQRRLAFQERQAAHILAGEREQIEGEERRRLDPRSRCNRPRIARGKA